MKSYPVKLEAQGLRFGIVVARFNFPVSRALLAGCTAELERRGAAPDDLSVAWVPGAFEIPLAARWLAARQTAPFGGDPWYDALIALGAVVRGGTPHFDYVCRAVTDGAREVMRDTGLPLAFGVLTVDEMEQARARCGLPAGFFARARGEPTAQELAHAAQDEHNKGAEAARAAIEMAQLNKVVMGEPGVAGAGTRAAGFVELNKIARRGRKK